MQGKAVKLLSLRMYMHLVENSTTGKKYNHWRIQGERQGCAPPGVQILSFSCSFQQKNLKIIALLGVGAPPRENPGSVTDNACRGVM